MCDANNLYDGYLRSIEGSKWKQQTQKVIINYLRYIFKIQKQLEERTYVPGVEGEFTLHERGKIRPITSLQAEDRIVRHVLCDHILMPEIEKKLIYDNGASIKGKGISFSRDRFDVHLWKYFNEHKTNEGWVLFGDFSKFYDNIIHEIIKKDILKLFDYDEYLTWLLDVIFKNFRIDVSYMTDEEFDNCLFEVFNKLDYRNLPKELFTGEKWMAKAVNIGDQLSQIIGVYHPNRIDTYVKYVRSQKYYGRYMDDWYIINQSKEELNDILDEIINIGKEYGIHINQKKTQIIRLDRSFKYLQIYYRLTETGKIIKKINPERISAIKEKLKKLSAKVKDGLIEYSNVENMFRSWMGSFYKIIPKKTRLELLQLYENLFNKTIIIDEGKLIFYDKTCEVIYG